MTEESREAGQMVETVSGAADPMAQYRAVREAVGIVHRSDQAQVRMWGRDPVKMLHGLITNDLVAAPPGRGVYATMLTPKGRVIAELRAFPRAGAGAPEVLVDIPREALAAATGHFAKFVPPMFARWADVSAEMGLVGVYGPRARELLTRLAESEIPELEEDGFVETSLAGVPVLATGTRYAGGEPGFDLFAAAPALPELRAALLDSGSDLGAVAVGGAVLDTLRIEAGRPRSGHELTEEIIPTEAFETTGLMPRAISFTKGCYTGQEVIVRIAHRGHVNRHLRGVRLGTAPPPPSRAPLVRGEEGKEVGWITSAARSPAMGETIALAYLRREINPGDRVRLGGPDGPEAAVTALPFSREA